MAIKPILFNTDMVRAILDSRKTVTRRAVKPQPKLCGLFKPNWNWRGIKQPYQPGDILYVRETWAEVGGFSPRVGEFWQRYIYLATYKPNYELDVPAIKWRPSIHMPRKAARIFLRVTDVRVERLRDISEEQAQAEGFYKGWKRTEHSSMALTATQAFMWMWDYTIKSADRAIYGWDANPWVWVIAFERCGKPEGWPA